jgi:hypothetical protein
VQLSHELECLKKKESKKKSRERGQPNQKINIHIQVARIPKQKIKPGHLLSSAAISSGDGIPELAARLAL